MCINGFPGIPVEGLTLSQPQNDRYGLRIVDHGELRSLVFQDVMGRQRVVAQMNLEQPETLVQIDRRGLLASFLLVPVQGRSLVVGLRNLGLIRFLRNFTPAQFIDVAEENPELIRAADQWFGLKPDDQLTIRRDDRLEYLLSRPQGSYDVIYLDQGVMEADGVVTNGLSDHARRLEVMTGIRDRLTDQGVLIVALETSPRTVERDADSVIAVFPHVFVWESPETGVTLLAALKHRQIINPLILRERARKLDQWAYTGFSFHGFIDHLLAGEYRVQEI
ncbi:spermidine synthase [Parendozoicomonas haliclonae]|uniref:Spermidine synthase n=1 Tax=Parendozoicomonas haliclonae TaxID=1960125 RepID=A0A1X7AQI1_9GAMM|nr:hypothetical protein [Parendozoicomonas haliclonae]SMA50413.1 spermidine synthase [Parendozoicomonas haliclonae]